MRTTRMRTRAPVRQNPMRACALSVAPSGAESWAGGDEKCMPPPPQVPWEEVGAGARPPMPSSTVLSKGPRVSGRQTITAACAKHHRTFGSAYGMGTGSYQKSRADR